MGIQKWSDEITVVELSDSPQFADDMTALLDQLDETAMDVVLNFAGVGFINSSDVAKLLRVRKKIISVGRRLMMCDVSSQVYGIFNVTGLEKMFEFTNDIATALTSIQLANELGGEK